MYEAIPFIICKDTEYVVTEESKKFLSNINYDISVLSIVGKYRTGKSLFLNKGILNIKECNGFNVGSSVQACTKGIWIYTKIMDSDGKRILVMDTEGIGSLDANSTHDSRIFSLALLLSSYFIYNSVGSIDENAIQTLSLVTNISKTITSSNKEFDTNGIYPEFMWLVRDFTLRLTNENGEDISSKEYLESALNGQDEVRNTIKETFRNRTCRTLVRPCNDENDLQSMCSDKVILRESFVQQINDINRYIFKNIKPKQMFGCNINGELLYSLAESYVNVLNSGSTPVIEDVWNMMSKQRCNHIFERCMNMFNIADETDMLYNIEVLNKKLDDMIIKSVELFERNAKGIESETIREKLMKSLESRKCELVTKNMTEIRNVMYQYVSSISNSVNSFSKLDELRSAVSNITKKLIFEYGDSIADSWNLIIMSNLWDWLRNINSNTAKVLNEFETKFNTMKREHVQCKMTWETHHNQLETQLISLSKLLEEKECKIIHFEQNMKLKKSEIDGIKIENSKIGIELKKEFMNNVKIIEDSLNNKIVCLEAECEKHKKELVECNKKLKTYSNIENELNERINSLKCNLIEFERSESFNKLEMEEYIKKNDMLSKEIKTVRAMNDVSVKENSLKTLNAIKQTRKEFLKTLNSAQNENKELQFVAKNTNDTFEKIKEELMNKISDQDYTISEYKNERKRTKIQYDNDIDKYEKQNKKMRSMIASHKEDTNELVVKMESIWKNMFDDKCKQIERLNKQLRDESTSNNRLQMTLERKKSDIEHEIRNHKRHSQQLEEQLKKRPKFEQCVDSNKRNYELLEISDVKKTKTIENLRTENEKLKNQNHQLNHAMELEKLKLHIALAKIGIDHDAFPEIQKTF